MKSVVDLGTDRPKLPSARLAALAVLLGFIVSGIVVFTEYRSPRETLLFTVAAAVAVAGCFSARFAIVGTVAAFCFSALLRRLVPAIEPGVDPTAVFPFLVAIPLAARGLRVHKPTAVAALLIFSTASAALSLTAPLTGLGGWLNFSLPLLAAFGVRAIPSGFNILARSTVICGSIAATYGIVQTVVPFHWDVVWLENVDFDSVGEFGKDTFRPFATLPAPGTAAVLIGVVVLILLFRRDLYEPSRAVRSWAIVSSVVFLMLSQVRSVWVGLALAVFLGFVARGQQTSLRIAASIGVVLAALAISPQRQNEIVANRAGTLTDVGSDPSFRGRLQTFQHIGDFARPVGTGIGSHSTASRAESTRDRIIDNGYIVVLTELGILGLILLVWVFASAVKLGTTPDRPFLIFLAVNNLAGLVGGLTLVALWAFSGITRRAQQDLPSDATLSAASVTEVQR